MDEVEVGAYNINKTKTKFSFGGSNLGSKRAQKPPEKPAKVSKLDTMASAEEKFDAIFGAPARKLLLLTALGLIIIHQFKPCQAENFLLQSQKMFLKRLPKLILWLLPRDNQRK